MKSTLIPIACGTALALMAIGTVSLLTLIWGALP
jgi:hypothetical protein